MTDKHVLIALIVLIIIRYQLDLMLFNAVGAFVQAIKDRFAVDYEEEVEVEPDWQDNYDARIERMRKELDEFNQSPTNAETVPGLFNIPHESVKLDIELEPSIEVEDERGTQEIAD